MSDSVTPGDDRVRGYPVVGVDGKLFALTEHAKTGVQTTGTVAVSGSDPTSPGSVGSGSVPWAPNTAYTAGQLVTHAGTLYLVASNFTSPSVFDTNSLTPQATTGANTYTAQQTAPDIAVQGLVGASQAMRFAGATASGAPTSGTFAVGDTVLSLADGKWWVCTAGGTPGTWVSPSGAAAPLLLTGTSDTIQLAVKANGTQTGDIVQFQDSGGSQMSGIKPDGSFWVGTSRFANVSGDGSNGIKLNANAGTTFTVKQTGRCVASGGVGAFGVDPPAAQPAHPTTLADVIAILQAAGFCA